MKDAKPLMIPSRTKVAGLHVYCSKCDRLVTSKKCGKSGKKISTCQSPQSHSFKAFVEVPGCKPRKKRSRTFETRDITEAIVLMSEFEEELKDNAYQRTNILSQQLANERPVRLIDCMSKYIGFLNNEGVLKHKQKKRDENYIKEVVRTFTFFCESLKWKKIDHTIIRVDSLNDKMVEIYHDYLKQVRKLENITYNKYMAYLRRSINWIITKFRFDIVNPFEEVSRLEQHFDTETIEKSEFLTLLKLIKPENGYKVFPSGERKNMYKNWMPHAFVMALETGLRREEYMHLKYNCIFTDKSGKPSYFKIENFKVNRIKGVEEEKSKRFKLVPITKNMLDELYTLGYEKFKGTDNYILGKDERASRKSLIDKVSKSFTHYWKQTGIQKDVSLKHLRKTYLTALTNHFGDKANIISDHASMEVLNKHYLNNNELVRKAGEFSVFSDLKNQ